MEMNTLQKLINKRAEGKLDKEINELCTPILRSKLIKDTTSTTGYPFVKTSRNNGTEVVWVNKSLEDIFRTDYSIMQELKKYWLPTYIEEETKLFLKEIEDTKSRVESLESEIGNIYSAIPQ